MKNIKKTHIFISIITILAMTAGIFWFVVYMGFPYLKHENALKTPEVLCLRLGVSHGCRSENYTKKELEQYIKEDVLTKISMQEVENIVFDTQNQNNKTEQNCNTGEQCEEYTLRYIERIKKYYAKLIPVIQKIKQEQE